jgi:hypothetical protein
MSSKTKRKIIITGERKSKTKEEKCDMIHSLVHLVCIFKLAGSAKKPPKGYKMGYTFDFMDTTML